MSSKMRFSRPIHACFLFLFTKLVLQPGVLYAATLSAKESAISDETVAEAPLVLAKNLQKNKTSKASIGLTPKPVEPPKVVTENVDPPKPAPEKVDPPKPAPEKVDPPKPASTIQAKPSAKPVTNQTSLVPNTANDPDKGNGMVFLQTGERYPRPLWRIVTGSVLLAGGITTLGFGAWGLSLNGACVDSPEPPMLKCKQVFNTVKIGSGLVVAGGLVTIGSILMIALPERKLPPKLMYEGSAPASKKQAPKLLSANSPKFGFSFFPEGGAFFSYGMKF